MRTSLWSVPGLTGTKKVFRMQEYIWKRRFSYRKYRDLIQGFLFTVTVLVQYLIAVFENLDLQLQLQYSGNPCTVTVRYNLALWWWAFCNQSIWILGNNKNQEFKPWEKLRELADNKHFVTKDRIYKRPEEFQPAFENRFRRECRSIR